MTQFVFLLYGVLLASAVLLTAYNLLYVKGLRKTMRQTGIHAPSYMTKLSAANILLSLFALGFTLIFMLLYVFLKYS